MVDPGWLLRSCKYLLQVDPLRRLEANPGSCKGGLSGCKNFEKVEQYRPRLDFVHISKTNYHITDDVSVPVESFIVSFLLQVASKWKLQNWMDALW